MADGNKVVVPYKTLSLREVDRINECAYQVAGILMLLRIAYENEKADVPEDAVSGACWAAAGLVKEMDRLATSKETDNG